MPHEPGHEEGKMAKAQAYELMKDAEDVCRMIGDGDNLPEWLEAKITLVSSFLTLELIDVLEDVVKIELPEALIE